MAEFEYFNLNDVDPTFHPIPKGVYAYRVAKLEYRTVTPKSGKNAGVEVPIVSGSFSVINHDEFSGRRIRHTFWITNPYDQKSLRRFADAIGIMQEPGEPLQAYIERLNSQNPALEFRTFTDVKPGQDGGEGDNEMKWNQVLPIA